MFAVFHHQGRHVEIVSKHELAQDALDACASLNEAEREANGGALDGGHYYGTDASCTEYRCKGVALTPGGQCADCASEESENEVTP